MLSQSAVFHKSKNFTSDCEIPMPPTVPINHYFRPAACAQQSCTHTGQQKTGPKVLFCCSMLIYSSKKCACFEHSNFFKVKPQIPRPQEGGKCMLRRQMNASKQTHKSIREKEMHPWQSAEETQRTMPRITPSLTPRKKNHCIPKSDYELFNCNNFSIRYWSWNYRGCWHQTCPPIDTR